MTPLYTVCSEKQITKSQTCFSSLDMFFRSSDLSVKCSASSLKLHFFMSVITSRSCLFITWNTYMCTILTVSFQMNPGYLVGHGPMQLLSHHLTLSKHRGWLNLSLTYLLGHTHLLTAPGHTWGKHRANLHCKTVWLTQWRSQREGLGGSNPPLKNVKKNFRR